MKAGNLDKVKNKTISHLFASMFKIQCYICPDNLFYLTHLQIGLFWMRNKITRLNITSSPHMPQIINLIRHSAENRVMHKCTLTAN